MQKGGKERKAFSEQTQARPGKETQMNPVPKSSPENARKGRLEGKNCIITGGDSGIGRAVALAFAEEGAEVGIVFLPADKEDATRTAADVKKISGKKCRLYPADIASEKKCASVCKRIISDFKEVHVLVNNAGQQYPEKDFLDITTEHLLKTFHANIFSMFWMTQNLLNAMPEGAAIVNTTSVTAYRGSPALVDYSSTKGAVVSFTRSLSANLLERKVRVNGVAPGPIWTPLIPSTFPKEKVAKFGTDSPMKRPGQPEEVAPAYVFLASDDSSYVSGQVIHVNGGEIVNG